MSIRESCFTALTKNILGFGTLFTMILAWQANQAPLMGQFGSHIQEFPQVVLNAGSTTTFSIHNPSTTEAIQVQVRIYSPGGTELASRDVDLQARWVRGIHKPPVPVPRL